MNDFPIFGDVFFWTEKFKIFSIKIFDLEKKNDPDFFSRAKIVSGIQKSYLERRAMSANVLKIQIYNGVL